MTTPEDPRSVLGARVRAGYDQSQLISNKPSTGPLFSPFYPNEFYDAFADEEGEGDGSEGNPDGRPAVLSIIPTTTSNPNRPRTLAAGYDVGRKTLTVLFRDGVLFNYYDVEVDQWRAFKNTFSKGVWIRNNLESPLNGEKVTGGRADAIADAIVSTARALGQANIGRQIQGYQRDQNKVSGYRRAVLKYVDRGRGLSTEAAQIRAKAELTFYRKRR